MAFGLDFEYFQDRENGEFFGILFVGDGLDQEVIDDDDEFGIGLRGVFVVLFSDVSIGFFEEEDFFVGEGKSVFVIRGSGLHWKELVLVINIFGIKM
jgi:hypothetical protein